MGNSIAFDGEGGWGPFVYVRARACMYVCENAMRHKMKIIVSDKLYLNKGQGVKAVLYRMDSIELTSSYLLYYFVAFP